MSKKDRNQHWRYISKIAWVVGISAGITSLATSITSVKSTKSAMDLTINLHGPDGIMDIVLENQGILIVDFGNDRRQAKIGENGRVNFEEIPHRFRRSTFSVTLKNVKLFEIAEPGKVYSFSKEPVYIKLNRISTIEGVVRNQALEAIDSATIIIDRDPSLKTYTNEYGKFEITIPQEKANPNFEILIEKSGYRIDPQDYNVGSTPLDIKLVAIDSTNHLDRK